MPSPQNPISFFYVFLFHLISFNFFVVSEPGDEETEAEADTADMEFSTEIDQGKLLNSNTKNTVTMGPAF